MDSSPSRKQKEINEIPSTPQFLKFLPQTLPQQMLAIIHTLTPINEDFQKHLTMLNMYRSTLGTAVEASWIQMLNFCKRLVWHIDLLGKKKETQHQDNVAFMVSERTKMENEIRGLKQNLSIITSLKEIQQSEAEEALREVDNLKREINDIHNIVQKDMNRVMQYLLALQKADRTEVSGDIFSCLERLALSLNRLEDESQSANATLSTMDQVIKAMVRNTKTDAFTQLEQTELQSKAQYIFPKEREKVDLERAELSSVNMEKEIDRVSSGKHVLDQLRIKEHDHPPHPIIKKNIESSWVLPASIMLFLENMARENENGRVLPWDHVKKLIYEVYSERISHRKDILAGQVGNVVPMDEFLVMMFIRKFNMRRLAQLKLLEFLISVKYYTRFWSKAHLFACVLDIMRLNPAFEVSDTNIYKFDAHTQYFFFHLLSQFDRTDLNEEEDGATFIEFEILKTKLRPLLFFCQQLNASRLFAKLEKTMRLQEKMEYVDFDLAISLSVQEYFFSRKGTLAEIAKSFIRVSDLCQGYFSVKEVASVFNQFEEHYNKGEETYGAKHPASSGIQLCKLYLYSITSGKNGFSIACKDFLSACQRYGFDCPIPFLHECNPSFKRRSKLEKATSLSQKKTFGADFYLKQGGNQSLSPWKDSDGNLSLRRMESVPFQLRREPKENPYDKRIEIGTHLFSQHFSILRQLQEYCQMFRSQLSKETDLYTLWGEFDNILKVLDKGCCFLNFPLKH